MGMMIFIGTMLCVTLSLLLTIDAASIPGRQLQVFYELANDYQLDHHTLPRKLLIVNSKVEGSESKSLVSSNEQNKDSSGELDKKGKEEVKVEVMLHGAKGTRQEWVEASDQTHEFFTMDYSHVRRRRPIHNKSFPKTAMNSP